MNWKSLLKPANNLNAEEAREFMASRSDEDYQLLDVRQPKEYESEHLPGARLIPLKQLAEGLKDLDEGKPVLVYCAVGGRSRAAAQFLAGQGFNEVYNISGGIKKWQGLNASGPETQGLELIDVNADFESSLTLSYALEDGLQQFYARLAEKVEDPEQQKLLERLAGFEDKHKAWLAEEYNHLHADQPTPPVPSAEQATMEGGRSVSQFLERVRPEFLTMTDIFDMAMMFETQAMDLYGRLANQASDASTADLFRRLVDEEKMHLGYLEKEFDRVMSQEGSL
jgi:rhodanese-related sulfurtransferase/rubrerythrin